MIKCPVCQTENTDDTRFCKGCGIKISAALEAARRVKLNPIQCPACHSENSSDTVFCKKCGLQIAENIEYNPSHAIALIRCPKCGNTNPSGTRYCGVCSQPLTQEAADQLQRNQVPARAVPEYRRTHPAVVLLTIILVIIALAIWLPTVRCSIPFTVTVTPSAVTSGNN